MRPSRLLRNTVKLSDKRHYQIAHEAGLHPSTLSRLIERLGNSTTRCNYLSFSGSFLCHEYGMME